MADTWTCESDAHREERVAGIRVEDDCVFCGAKFGYNNVRLLDPGVAPGSSFVCPICRGIMTAICEGGTCASPILDVDSNNYNVVLVCGKGHEYSGVLRKRN